MPDAGEFDVGTEYRGSSRRGPFRNDTARVINNVCFNVNLRRGSNLISTEATRSNADGDWLGGIARRSPSTERGGERRREERRGRGRAALSREEEERKEEEEEERRALEEDEQEGPLGIVRGRSLVTRDSCDPDDP